MLVQITSKFYDDSSIAQAYKKSNAGMTFLVVWSGIAKKMLQAGVPKLKKPELDKVPMVVEIDTADNPAFKAMQEDGMVSIVEAPKDLVSEVPAEKFEEFWKAYPPRVTNGKKIKVGKSKAQKIFTNTIRTLETFSQLMKALDVYVSQLGTQSVRDAERFLRKDGEDAWRYFLAAEDTASAPAALSKKPVLSPDQLASLKNQR